MKSKTKRQYYQAKKRGYGRKRKLIFRSRFFWCFVLAAVIGAGFVYFFVFSPVFQLKDIKVSGASYVSASEVENLIIGQSERNILFFPTKSIIVFNSRKAEAMILENFLPVERAQIKRQFFNKLAVILTERKTEAAACFAEDCFLTDASGIVFRSADREEVFPNKPRLILDNLPELGAVVISGENLVFVSDIFGRLKQRNILIEEFAVMESKIGAKISEGGLVVYFSTQKDSELQVQDLILVLEDQSSPDAGHQRAEEYIDLRFDKIFLK
ncbi:MAG: hypothetical protein COT37_01280 [Parcubacteria group bacterium CG08_land_8_20_14_0_20_43_9]|nr:MAG: hypothetical protein COT37_01280 [Parcubacteria group bacterium CG08_land_8_20_14_0_20_43_9]